MRCEPGKEKGKEKKKKEKRTLPENPKKHNTKTREKRAALQKKHERNFTTSSESGGARCEMSSCLAHEGYAHSETIVLPCLRGPMVEERQTWARAGAARQGERGGGGGLAAAAGVDKERPETRDQRPETRDQRPETRDQTRDQKTSAQNGKHPIHTPSEADTRRIPQHTPLSPVRFEPNYLITCWFRLAHAPAQRTPPMPPPPHECSSARNAPSWLALGA